MSTKELIQAIEALMFTPPYHGPRSEGFNGGASAAIDLITTHMAGKVIVPVEPTDAAIDAFFDAQWESLSGAMKDKRFGREASMEAVRAGIKAMLGEA